MEFDWVTARASCSPSSVFAVLCEVIRSDVDTANKLPAMERVFQVTSQSGRKMIVARTDEEATNLDMIVFELSSLDILVRRGPEQVLFRARPALNEEGDCRLEIDGRCFKLWQVSRKALEDLFFL